MGLSDAPASPHITPSTSSPHNEGSPMCTEREHACTIGGISQWGFCQSDITTHRGQARPAQGTTAVPPVQLVVRTQSICKKHLAAVGGGSGGGSGGSENVFSPTLPSLCWCVSNIARITLGTAIAVPFSVCAKLEPFSPNGFAARMSNRRALQSEREREIYQAPVCIYKPDSIKHVLIVRAV